MGTPMSGVRRLACAAVLLLLLLTVLAVPFGCADDEMPDTIAGTRASTNDTTKPVANFTVSSWDIVTGENVTFNASTSYDPDNGTIVNYTWNFGDGNVSYGMVVKHAYQYLGEYVVTLNITDAAGNWQWTAQTFGTHPPPKPDLMIEMLYFRGALRTTYTIKADVVVVNAGEGISSANAILRFWMVGILFENDIPPIYPGESITVTFKLNFAREGTYDILAVVFDPEESLTTEYDNNYTTTITIQPHLWAAYKDIVILGTFGGMLVVILVVVAYLVKVDKRTPPDQG